MAEHIVASFDEDLKNLTSAIADMGGRAEQMVARAMEALEQTDTDSAEQAVRADREINALHEGIDEQAVIIITRRQPMAHDLREIICAVRISVDLERIGDLGKNIARRTLAIAETGSVDRRYMTGLAHLSRLCLRQLKAVLDSYAARDLEKAHRVWTGDDEVDAVYTSLFREMLTYMIEDPRSIGMCTHLLFCAKNLERVGDHATNIAETVHYLVTGEQLEGMELSAEGAG